MRYTENQSILINGIQPGDEYQVFDLSGRLFATGKSTGTQTKINATKGTYVIIVNGNSHKVIVY